MGTKSSLLADLPQARLLRLLSCSRRLDLLLLLNRHESDVSELADAVGMSVSQASSYLRELRKEGYVQRRTVGVRRLHSTTDRVTIERIDESTFFKLAIPDGRALIIGYPD